jgi:hypothetical protein
MLECKANSCAGSASIQVGERDIYRRFPPRNIEGLNDAEKPAAPKFVMRNSDGSAPECPPCSISTGRCFNRTGNVRSHVTRDTAWSRESNRVIRWVVQVVVHRLRAATRRTSRHAEACRDIISHARKIRAVVISQICIARGGDPGADRVDSRGAASICLATCSSDAFSSLSAQSTDFGICLDKPIRRAHRSRTTPSRCRPFRGPSANSNS